MVYTQKKTPTNIRGSLPRRNRPIKSLRLREETDTQEAAIAGSQVANSSAKLQGRKEKKANRWSAGPNAAERLPVRHSQKCSGRGCEERTQPTDTFLSTSCWAGKWLQPPICPNAPLNTVSSHRFCSLIIQSGEDLMQVCLCVCVCVFRETSMQRRWKMDKYLSYLSCPPLPCYCSSLWSPAVETNTQ